MSPVWISFYALPLHMFNFHALSLICKLIGKLLGVDSVTLAKAKPHVARVCVEMDLLKPRPKEIFVGTSEVVGEEDCGFVQPVADEKVPYYCDYCWRQGHSLDKCKLQDFEPQNPKPNPFPKSNFPKPKASLPTQTYVPKAQKPNTQIPSPNPNPPAQNPPAPLPNPQPTPQPKTQAPSAQNPPAPNPPAQNPPAPNLSALNPPAPHSSLQEPITPALSSAQTQLPKTPTQPPGPNS
ncbi:hypothetical protein DM860_012723 [Cuscuta australis]|uniref:Uncharacterized protein n=1 Tax=Cuscuta australis TaxID=267555 RepID=A0A328DCK7_9ASTE|nr:hypothetical protein DM860_012723 [Cuscuta australis]